jgi:L-ribulose-5-phosphate 3-epimerase
MSPSDLTRREFVQTSASALTAAAVGSACARGASESQPLFRISLAQWSLHRSMFGAGMGDDFTAALHRDPDAVLQGDLDPLDFARIAKNDYGISAVEYVNTFFFGHATDMDYLRELRTRADGEGVRSVLIMCDAEGNLGAPSEEERVQAVENHKKWADAAAFLGCHAIRVNARSEGSREEQQRLAADGLHRLAEYVDTQNISVLVENHGGFSSDGSWLAGVMKLADHPRVGTLPDFGNFRVSPDVTYDRYQGVTEMMPYAKAVSAKSYDFDAEGNETMIDYHRMMRIVLDAGYRGHVGIEYEGDTLTEPEGIRATKRLLERVRDELTPEYT